MSHELEIIDGKVSHAFVGEVPWHNLGQNLPIGATPHEMLVAANLNWTVAKSPLLYSHKGIEHETDRSALFRESDGKFLSSVSNDWNPVQNEEAFEFFEEWTKDGLVTMETAGSLKGGTIVWALAKVKDGAFDVVRNDKIESYLLFSNPHIYGKSVTVQSTNIRVVCNNTFTLAMSKSSQNKVNVSHHKAFDPEIVKMTLGFSKAKTKEYKERAKFLATKDCTKEQIHEYLNKLFPIGEKAVKQDKTFSKPAQKIFDVIETQPGAKYAKGTFWQLFNAVTYATDHVLGNSADTRLQSSWYGANQGKKIEALQLAVEMAS